MMSWAGSALCSARLSKVRLRRFARLKVGITAETGSTCFFECIDIRRVYISARGKRIGTRKNIARQGVNRIIDNELTGLTLQRREIHRPSPECRLTALGRFPIRKWSW